MHNISFQTLSLLLNSRYLIPDPAKETSESLYWHQLIDLLLKLVLLIIIISIFVPFSPKMPAPGLDASWALGLNQAVGLGLSFGKEIIFTLGPYSSIYTKAYHPSTDLMMIGGSLYLACSYWMSIIFLMKGIKWHWTVAFSLCLLGMIYARDSLFFSYPLLVGLTSYNITCSKTTKPQNGLQHQITLVVIALLFAPFGLLPLIKGSLLILCIIVAMLCSLFFTLYRRNSLAFVCLASPIASLLLFWVGSGQAMIYLPHYIINSLSIAAGFTQAMAIDGNSNELILFLMASSLILFSIAWQKQIVSFAKIFLFCIFFVFLFLSFKTGFTRHFGHAFISGTSILMAALLLPYLFNSRILIPVIIFSIYTASYIDGHYTRISIYNNVTSTYFSTWHGLKNRIKDKNWLNQNFDLMMHFLQEQVSFPMLHGTTDIYSYNQAYLIAAKMTWSPRPIFQSYSVFTPMLAEKNKDHLLSKHRPDNIIFRVEPIDGRIPSMEDGPSWPVLIKNYQPTHLVKDFLLLHRKNSAKQRVKPMKLLSSESHIFGEVVNVPARDQPIFAEIDIKPTIWGLLATTFFKPNPLQITFVLNNGIKKHYRIIANMAKAGFLLSPLIENTNEFALLYDNQHFLEPKQVKSLSITSSPSKTWHWNDEYVIHFKSLELRL